MMALLLQVARIPDSKRGLGSSFELSNSTAKIVEGHGLRVIMVSAIVQHQFPERTQQQGQTNCRSLCCFKFPFTASSSPLAFEQFWETRTGALESRPLAADVCRKTRRFTTMNNGREATAYVQSLGLKVVATV